MLLAAPCGWAGDDELFDSKRHPIKSFPLRVAAGHFDDDIARALRRAVQDWNAVFRDTLETSVPAFVFIDYWTTATNVVVNSGTVFLAPGSARINPPTPIFHGPPAETTVYADRSGRIIWQAQIVIRPLAAQDGVDRETLFYGVIFRELGHALGLPRPDDAMSIRSQLAERYFMFLPMGPP